LFPAIGLAAPKDEVAPKPPPKVVLDPKPLVDEFPTPKVVFEGLTKPPPVPKVELPAPKAGVEADAPSEVPRLPKVAVGAAVPRGIVGGPAWLLLRREFLACTKGSVGAEKGLGPESEGRGVA